MSSLEIYLKKAMRGKRMASKLFAPYDGITRFRFKGSSDRSNLSASGSPAPKKG